jgi:CHASE3 domain sensor protein
MTDAPHDCLARLAALEAAFVEYKSGVASLAAQQDKTLVAATDSLNHRLNEMNQFRDQLREQAAHFITRAEHDVLTSRVERTERGQANMQGRYTVAAVIFAIVVTVVQIGLAVLTHLSL